MQPVTRARWGSRRALVAIVVLLLVATCIVTLSRRLHGAGHKPRTRPPKMSKRSRSSDPTAQSISPRSTSVASHAPTRIRNTTAPAPRKYAKDHFDDKRLHEIFNLRAASKNYDGGSLPANAYLVIVSNEDFVDGALVMGVSLRLYSTALSSGDAHLVLIATAGRLSASSLSRLQESGRYDAIFEVPSLAVKAPKAALKDTFDKSYMFALVQYKKVVFADADMIAMQSMDKLFEKDYGNESELGAIGFRGHGGEEDYFQTGMMVIKPSWTMFDRIMKEFLDNVPPRGSVYNEGMHGRDGVLLRAVFGTHFHEIDNKYSRNLNPRWAIPKSVVALHLRGSHKPWYHRGATVDNPAMGKKEFGFPFLEWWRLYEEHVHRKSPEYVRCSTLPSSDPKCRMVPASRGSSEAEEAFGGRYASPSVSPLTHVWMMRYTKREYVQLLSDEDARRRKQLSPGERFFVGEVGMSCTEVCATRDSKCVESSLFNSQLQDCAFLATLAPECEKACELAVYWKPHPGKDYPAVLQKPSKKDHAQTVAVRAGEAGPPVCRFNLLFDERSRPTCDAFNETTRRFCPCLHG